MLLQAFLITRHSSPVTFELLDLRPTEGFAAVSAGELLVSEKDFVTDREGAVGVGSWVIVVEFGKDGVKSLGWVVCVDWEFAFPERLGIRCEGNFNIDHGILQS